MEDIDCDPEHNESSQSSEGSSCLGFGCCGVSLFLISAVSYCVTMGVGWAFSRNVVPEDNAAFAAAIISTIPVFAVIAYIYLVCKFGRIEGVKEVGFICLIIIELCAALFEFIGGMMFLIVGIQAEDNRIKAFGASAAAFGFLSASSCCCGLYCCCIEIGDDS